MFWITLTICIVIVFQSCSGSWQRAGTLRNVIWEYKYFLTYPDRKVCNMTQLLKSCEMDNLLERNAVAFQVIVFAKRDSIHKVRCAAGRRFIQGCYLVECVGMPPRVWCRSFLPKCMLFGKMNTQCYSVSPGECEINICKNEYVFYPELCLNHSNIGVRESLAKDFIFCAKTGESNFQVDAEGFVIDYKGRLHPTNKMLFTLICLVAPFFIKFFLPHLWRNIAYALFMRREARPVKEKIVPKKPCPPPPPPFCWKRWLLGWLLRACEALRRASECRGPPLCGAAAASATFPPSPQSPAALLGPCGAVCAAVGLSPLPPATPPPSPRGPLFSRDTRIYPPIVAADVEYRSYVDSLFTSGRESAILPFEIEGHDARSVCLKPVGAVFQSREYAAVQRLLTGYAARRRGLGEDAPPEPSAAAAAWQRFAALGLDPRRLALARTYLGTLQDAYNCLQPAAAHRRAPPEADAGGADGDAGGAGGGGGGGGGNVYVHMLSAQENLRRTLWSEIERAAVSAARQRECSCDKDDDEK